MPLNQQLKMFTIKGTRETQKAQDRNSFTQVLAEVLKEKHDKGESLRILDIER